MCPDFAETRSQTSNDPKTGRANAGRALFAISIRQGAPQPFGRKCWSRIGIKGGSASDARKVAA